MAESQIAQNYLDREIAALEAGASGYVPGTDYLISGGDYEDTQTIVANAAFVDTTLNLVEWKQQGDQFAVGTKSIQIINATLVAGSVIFDVATNVAANATLEIIVVPYGSDTGSDVLVDQLSFNCYTTLLSGRSPYLEYAFMLTVTPGTWLRVSARCTGANVITDDFGGLNIYKIA